MRGEGDDVIAMLPVQSPCADFRLGNKHAQFAAGEVQPREARDIAIGGDGEKWISVPAPAGKDGGASGSGGLPLPLACYVVQKICEGLDYAHNKRDASGQETHLVHRDVSSANVLVEKSVVVPARSV